MARGKKKRERNGDPQEPAPTPQPVRQTTREWAMGWVKSLLVAFVLWFFIQAFLIKSFRIISDSMVPTLLVGDLLFINKTVYGATIPFTNSHLPALRDPRDGELIVLKGVEEPVLTIVKRVIGTEGDTLELRSDSLFRNGRYVPEPYTQHVNPLAQMDDNQRLRTRNWQLPHLVDSVDKSKYLPDLRNWGPVVVPPEHLFTMGDNRDESYDGRHWGFLPRENVVGKVLIIYYSYDANHWRPLPFLTAPRFKRFLRRPH